MGKTINFCNSTTRRYLFKHIGKYIYDGFGMVLLDLDLVSCFTCILLGLYPDKLPLVHKAVNTVEIWNAIKKKFINLGKETSFHKPYVKICFYSVIFGGGSKAMVNGILDDECKKSGLRPEEFRESQAYSEITTTAQKIAQILNNLEVVQEFRTMSKDLQQTYTGEKFVGPTGHEYLISDTEFRKSFSMYLQSFEFAILAQSTLNTLNKFKTSELLYHFHDGNFIAVKEDEVDEFFKELSIQVENTGNLLRLSYKQNIELKCKYPEN